MFQHHKWEKGGRTYRDNINPNLYAFTTQAGDRENVDIGGGNYAPYQWDGNNLRHGRSIVNFGAGQQTISIGAFDAVNSSKFFVEQFQVGIWTDVPHGLPTRVVNQGDDEARVTLQFRPAEYDLDIDLIANSGSWGSIEIRFTPRTATPGDWRFIWENAGINKKVSGTEYDEFIVRKYDLDQNNIKLDTYTDLLLGLYFNDIYFKWSVEEAPYRSYEVISTGPILRTLRIFMGGYTVAQNETLTIFPDTFGPAQVGASARDGQELNDTTWDVNGYDSDGNRVGLEGSTLAYDMGVAWTSVTVPSGATISSAAPEFFMKYVAGTSDIVTRAYGFLTANVAAFDGTTNRPSQITKTTAYTDRTYTYASDFVDESWLSLDDMVDEFQEIIDQGGWSSGNAAGMVLTENGSSGNKRWQFQDYDVSSTHAAKITITYTTASTGNPNLLLLGVG